MPHLLMPSICPIALDLEPPLIRDLCLRCTASCPFLTRAQASSHLSGPHFIPSYSPSRLKGSGNSTPPCFPSPERKPSRSSVARHGHRCPLISASLSLHAPLPRAQLTLLSFLSRDLHGGRLLDVCPRRNSPPSLITPRRRPNPRMHTPEGPLHGPDSPHHAPTRLLCQASPR
jgi:hypothetical protein